MKHEDAMPGCVYVSRTDGVHDRRWLQALADLDQDPVFVCARDFPDEASLIRAVNDVSGSTIPVIAGPLDLAAALAAQGEEVIFLSWGFDLQARDTGLSALSAFAGVVVDCHANLHVARDQGMSNLEFIPWGIDLEMFPAEGAVMDLIAFGVSEDEDVLLSLRAHEPLYRVQDVIKAFAECPLTGTLVIGNTGSMSVELQQLSQETEKPIIFIPLLAESELPALLRRASVYVTASERDGTSVTLLQAMACGVPVAASNNAGNKDWIIDDFTGYTFDVGDLKGLSQAMTRACGADTRITSAARQQVLDRADWSENIHRLGSLITRVRQQQPHWR